MLPFRGVAVATRDGRPVTTVTGGGATPETRFLVASVSKNVAATLALRLVERGVLDLHAPLAVAPPAWAGITLHHLLSNSSGLGHWDDVPGVDPLGATPLEAVLRAPLLSAPGTQFHYSSPGYLVLGAVIEQATGSPYARVLADEILGPAGMSRTVSGIRPDDLAPPFSHGEPVASWSLTTAVGTGDLISTVNDLMAYARFVLPDFAPQIALPEPDRRLDGRLVLTGYGYGCFLGTFDGEPAAVTPGEVPGYRSLIAWLPGGTGVVALFNDDATDWDDVLRALV